MALHNDPVTPEEITAALGSDDYGVSVGRRGRPEALGMVAWNVGRIRRIPGGRFDPKMSEHQVKKTLLAMVETGEVVMAKGLDARRIGVQQPKDNSTYYARADIAAVEAGIIDANQAAYDVAMTMAEKVGKRLDGHTATVARIYSRDHSGLDTFKVNLVMSVEQADALLALLPEEAYRG